MRDKPDVSPRGFIISFISLFYRQRHSHSLLRPSPGPKSNTLALLFYLSYLI